MHEIHPTRRRPVRVRVHVRARVPLARLRSRARGDDATHRERIVADETGQGDPRARGRARSRGETRGRGCRSQATGRRVRRVREGGRGAGERCVERWERVREVVVVRRGERAHGEHGGARCVNEMNESSRATPTRRGDDETRRDEEEERGERRARECSRVKTKKKKWKRRRWS